MEFNTNPSTDPFAAPPTASEAPETAPADASVAVAEESGEERDFNVRVVQNAQRVGTGTIKAHSLTEAYALATTGKGARLTWTNYDFVDEQTDVSE